MEPTFTIPEFFSQMKELPEFKDSVIAGGFVRDNHLGRPFKDVDVFIPYVNSKTMSALFEFLNVNASKKDMKKYVTRAFNGKYDCEIEDPEYGKLEVDFVLNTLPSQGFGFSLCETFNYGLDMCFTDGKELFLTKEFEHDVENSLIRLCNLDGVHNLPHVMEKYNRLKEKYPNFEFSSDYVLERRKGAGWV